MIKIALIFFVHLGVLLTFNPLFSVGLRAAPPSLTPSVRGPDGTVTMTITGESTSPVTLQGTADLQNWTDLQTYQLTASPIRYQQSRDSQIRHQYFRLKSAESGLPKLPDMLPDLSAAANSVFVAGEGFDTVQFAPDGTLGFIFWNGKTLTLRERGASGVWSEQVITASGNLFQRNITRQDYNFQPAALLLYTADSAPHIFKLNGDKTISHFMRTDTTWSEADRIYNNFATGELQLLVGALGPDNTFHLATISGGDHPNLAYGYLRDGEWNWTNITPIGAFPRYYLAPSYAARWLSLAVDSGNRAHIVFRPEFRLSYKGGHVRVYNELAYASNESGSWVTRIVQKPADESGEAGNGLSIAIGPDDQPRIASWYNERGDGGSAQASRLYLHTRGRNGAWTKSEVISRPDGYIAGDDEKGTGFAPYLRFDARGRPHILFLDHGSEHFGESGQSEYAGHLRHAVLEDGWRWEVQTILRQTNPKEEQVLYPAFAINSAEIVVTALERTTEWNTTLYPPVVNSTYRFRVKTGKL